VCNVTPVASAGLREQSASYEVFLRRVGASERKGKLLAIAVRSYARRQLAEQCPLMRPLFREFDAEGEHTSRPQEVSEE
jgi:hypothetical protein